LPRAAGALLGQPRALFYLAFTEAWERFSYYGMTAILVLYMNEALLLPDRIGHVAGMAGFRAMLESVFGPLSTLALAAQISGYYTGLVYFTPILGGWLADRWIGPRKAVVAGALLMSAGHLAMAFDASFLAALGLLILGCGLLKGNVASQVGSLYAQDDLAGRTRGYTIFSMGINVGATIGPLACGALAGFYGWHAGFGLAGLLMLLGLATYLAGYRTLGASVRTAPVSVARAAPLTQAQWRQMAALITVMAITIFQSIAYYQLYDVGMIWIDRSVDLQWLGYRVPVPWFNSIDPFVSIVAVPPLFALWRYQAAHGGEPDELGKIGTGAWIAATANALLVIGSAGASKVPLLVPVLCDVLLGIAFLYYWPPLLALVSRTAPPKLRATMIGCVYLTLFISNTTLGILGGLFERIGPIAFWSMQTGIAATGGVLALLLRRRLTGILGDRAV
jgi:POT family proton-dependent oligopeptide transporter